MADGGPNVLAFSKARPGLVAEIAYLMWTFFLQLPNEIMIDEFHILTGLVIFLDVLSARFFFPLTAGGKQHGGRNKAMEHTS